MYLPGTSVAVASWNARLPLTRTKHIVLGVLHLRVSSDVSRLLVSSCPKWHSYRVGLLSLCSLPGLTRISRSVLHYERILAQADHGAAAGTV